MKNKIGLFIALLFLVISSSTSAADVNHPLKEWYQTQFKSISEELGTKTAIGLVLTIQTSRAIVQQSRSAFSLAMLEFRSAETREVILGIDEYRMQMQHELTNISDELMKQNFESYKSQLFIEQKVAEDIDALLAEVLSQE